MELIKRLCIPFFFGIFFNHLYAQSPLKPLRIEEKNEKYTESNSKYGTQVRTKKQLVIIYKDGTEEKATMPKLKTLFQEVPLAELEYKKHQRNNIYMTGSLPLFGVAFVGAINVINNVDKQKNAIIGLMGLATGIAVYEVFEYRKKRNMNRMIAHFNNYWKNDVPQSDLKNTVTPDVIRLGLINQNTLGVGLTWHITE